jgi:dihydrofolate reductase
MRVVLADVISLDGKIAKLDGSMVRDWASSEDGALLAELLYSSDVVLIGRNTYDQQKPGLHDDRLYVILTHHPDMFVSDAVTGKREFTNSSPARLMQELAERGYKNVLMLTGGEISAAFLKAGLVDELYLTIEPLIFGAGIPMLSGENLLITCHLESVARLNQQGTTLMHYLIERQSIL